MINNIIDLIFYLYEFIFFILRYIIIALLIQLVVYQGTRKKINLYKIINNYMDKKIKEELRERK